MNSTSSLLHWTRRMIEIRKRYAAFALGNFTDLGFQPVRAVPYTRCTSTETPVASPLRHTRAVREQPMRFPSRWNWICANTSVRLPIDTVEPDSPGSARCLPADVARTRLLLVEHAGENQEN